MGEPRFTFTGVIYREANGFSALCPELDVATAGSTPAEAKAMLLEAATLHLEGAIEDGLPYLRPVPADEDPRRIMPEAILETFRFTVDVTVHAQA
jgi:predicted RNase H-like HicB family nuclease